MGRNVRGQFGMVSQVLLDDGYSHRVKVVLQDESERPGIVHVGYWTVRQPQDRLGRDQ